MISLSSNLIYSTNEHHSRHQIWDLHNNHRVAALAPPLGETTLCSMCLSSKGTMIAVGSGQGKMKVWDLRIYDHTSRGVAFHKVVSSSPREPSFVHRGEVSLAKFNFCCITYKCTDANSVCLIRCGQSVEAGDWFSIQSKWHAVCNGFHR